MPLIVFDTGQWPHLEVKQDPGRYPGYEGQGEGNVALSKDISLIRTRPLNPNLPGIQQLSVREEAKSLEKYKGRLKGDAVCTLPLDSTVCARAP